ncbi:error-prone DNA polymerase [Leucobacter exalbidus]|uniref:Error-prone DNA polymerase n=1 Tax=Leucobacter exalbidus TaxID=662960 RepID=A0A940PWI8_9MICO|nr:error-prone DNA polymerase [Leucobacter exalbidus]MBP1325496.1 error-prone DNA polymerase [Leucobacter exalbidus]
MRWNNSPLSWQEFERKLSARTGPVTRPAPPGHTPSGQTPSAHEPTPQQPGSAYPDAPHVPYAELHAHSSFSFLDGASSPESLIAEATRLNLAGLAITDHNGLYGAAIFAEAAAHAARTQAQDPAPVQPHAQLQTQPPRAPLLTVYGAELSLGLDSPQLGVADPAGTHLLVLARGAAGYHKLAAAITEAQLAGGAKGRPRYHLADLADAAADDWVILTGCRKGAVRRALTAGSPSHPTGAHLAAATHELTTLTDLFGPDNVYVELTHHGHPADDDTNAALAHLAHELHLPTIATGGVHYATRAQAPLAEALAAVRARRSLAEMDPYLPATGAARLRSGAAMARRFARFPDAVTRTVPLASELAFSLRAATPRLPTLDVPDGHTQMSWLRKLTWEGAERCYGQLSSGTRERLERELAVIEQKDFPGYFLIVHDLVHYAKGRGILCQGRGSAANSAVCYVLGITAVDSVFYNLPFERFLSSMRDEEPDIDVDFDSGRREEVIQYVYTRYGRTNAAQVANVISYRPKAAIRDAAKALGYSAGQQTAWSRSVERRGALDDPAGQIPAPVRDLAAQMLKLPRHLGIHSGGMVLTERPVGEVCPIEHARMEGRTVLQWDKESCAWMGLVKFDLLGLGILSALQQAMDLVAEHTGERWEMSTIPKEEPGVYDMLCRADAIGVFQVESRAQLNTLPRLRPRSFYDLVIEIALIRPGPIQGGAVHPYLKRRSGEEPVTYPHPALAPVLERTLGVPLFQEQLMQMAMAVGNCSAEDADLLRRSMGSKRGEEHVASLREKLFAGMRANGLEQDEAQRIYDQIEAFASFGFAESHSISFALLVYVSAWFKLHYPAAFLAALLNAQPMGFYAPRTLVDDARRHGVVVLPADVQHSGAAAGLEPREAAGAGPLRSGSPSPHAPCTAAAGPAAAPASSSAAPPASPVPPFDPAAPDTSGAHRRDQALAVRLGLTGVRGIEQAAAERIVAARADGPFESLPDLARRAHLDRSQLEALAAAGACAGIGLDRRAALWAAAPAADHREQFLAGSAFELQPPLLPVLSPADQSALDLWSTGITTGAHPVAHLRAGLDAQGVVRSDALPRTRPGQHITVAGIVTHRQRPSTAGGVTFISLEDESGTVNVVVWAKVWERHRFIARSSPALLVRGVYERSPEGVGNIIAATMTPLAAPAGVHSRDFR